MQPHDFIHITHLTKVGISEKSAELFRSGQSIRAVAREIGISKTAARERLLDAGITLRRHSNDQSRTRARSIRTAPYEFCVIGGQLKDDPREQHVLQMILKWWRLGMSHCGIAKRLNREKIRPRMAREWSQPTVGFIIKRQIENTK